ncbi:hypothetical protein V5799_004440 [Amblyomma americanum]|uniref:Uncharacterized protein n=1 Tax=Amblyomma americanum TaxID=6943 RepID=A0AAQ4D638_AMBAM
MRGACRKRKAPFFIQALILFSNRALIKKRRRIANQQEPLDLESILPENHADYDSLEPPKENGKPTVVSFHVTVLSLDSIDEGSMTYVADIFMSQTWHDHRLRLPRNMTSKYRLLPVSWLQRMWRPDSFFKNAKRVTFQEMTIPNHYIWLYSDRRILYMVKLTLLLSCAMKFETYPHDTQVCTLKIESSNFTCIQLVFTLKRRLGYYMFHTYIPTCLIVIMSWISFWIKPEAVPARVTLCVTSLLTLSTQHAQSQKSLPPVSYIKAIDIFMSSCTVFVFASLMEYALVNILMGEAQPDDDGRRRSIRAVVVSPRISENPAMPNGTKLPKPPEAIASECRERAMLVDKISRVVFPTSFILLNCVYWSLYIDS